MVPTPIKKAQVPVPPARASGLGVQESPTCGIAGRDLLSGNGAQQLARQFGQVGNLHAAVALVGGVEFLGQEIAPAAVFDDLAVQQCLGLVVLRIAQRHIVSKLGGSEIGTRPVLHVAGKGSVGRKPGRAAPDDPLRTADATSQTRQLQLEVRIHPTNVPRSAGRRLVPIGLGDPFRKPRTVSCADFAVSVSTWGGH